jgi:hypothetical protein
MSGKPAHQLPEAIDNLIGFLGRELQMEMFDDDGLPCLGVLAAKNRAQAADPNLVQHAKATEGRGRNVGGNFPGQGWTAILSRNLLTAQ